MFILPQLESRSRSRYLQVLEPEPRVKMTFQQFYTSLRHSLTDFHSEIIYVAKLISVNF